MTRYANDSNEIGENIKQCPFCGGESDTYKDYTGAWYTYCQKKDCPAHFTTPYESEEASIKAWNTRFERTTKLTYEYDDKKGWRERIGRCQCGNILEVAELIGEGGNGGYMIVQSAIYCDICGSKVTSEIDD